MHTYARAHTHTHTHMQIDDGYQQHMGDWLSSSDQLGVPLHDLLDQLADTGIDMALWIAPFSASASSDILKEHPEWFVKDELMVEILYQIKNLVDDA